MMKFMEKMMGFMMDRTSKEEKHEMMVEMMERFFATMTPEDKQNMMEAMMPKMMAGMNMMDMMPKMMTGMMGEGEATFCIPETREDGQGMEMAGMPQMMMHMMPHCLEMMLPQLEQDQRRAFTLQMVATLMEHSCSDMPEEEKQQFVAEVMERVHAAEAV